MPDPFAKNSMLFPTASLANPETMLVGERRLDRLHDGSWCNNVGAQIDRSSDHEGGDR